MNKKVPNKEISNEDGIRNCVTKSSGILTTISMEKFSDYVGNLRTVSVFITYTFMCMYINCIVINNYL